MLCMIDTRNFFLKRNFCTEVCHCEQTSCARSVDHILKTSIRSVRIEWIRKLMFSKNAVSSKTTVFECFRTYGSDSAQESGDS